MDFARRQEFQKQDSKKKFSTSFENLYGQVVRDLCHQGLLQVEGQQIRMTKKGLFLGDTVAERFILE